jgi:hypothetical protein
MPSARNHERIVYPHLPRTYSSRRESNGYVVV